MVKRALNLGVFFKFPVSLIHLARTWWILLQLSFLCCLLWTAKNLVFEVQTWLVGFTSFKTVVVYWLMSIECCDLQKLSVLSITREWSVLYFCCFSCFRFVSKKKVFFKLSYDWLRMPLHKTNLELLKSSTNIYIVTTYFTVLSLAYQSRVSYSKWFNNHRQQFNNLN